MGSPPLPQPEGHRVVSVRRSAQRRLRVRWVFFLRVMFQMKRRDAGRRQRRVSLRALAVAACRDRVDPGSGLLAFQMLSTTFAGAVFMVRKRLRFFFRKHIFGNGNSFSKNESVKEKSD